MTVNISVVSDEIVKRFACFLKNDKLAHAYLFIGPKSIGKSETAFSIAKLVNCEHSEKGVPCEKCSSCVKIEKKVHPDIHLIGFNDESIKIENIREMLSRIQLRSFEAKTKVFLLKDVDCLTLEAGNALLKTLEEPNRDSLILLTTSASERILDTIQSRCQKISFFPMSNVGLRKHMVDVLGKDYGESHFLSYFAEGCPAKVSDKDSKKIFDRKNEAIDEFMFAKDVEPYLKRVGADKLQIAEILQFLFFWFRDLIMIKQGVSEESLVNFDRVSDIQKVKGDYELQELEEILEEIVNTKKALDDNFNVKISLAILKEKIWRR